MLHYSSWQTIRYDSHLDNSESSPGCQTGTLTSFEKYPPHPLPNKQKQAICHHHMCGTVSLLVGGAKMAFNVEGWLCLIQEVHLRPLVALIRYHIGWPSNHLAIG